MKNSPNTNLKDNCFEKELPNNLQKIKPINLTTRKISNHYHLVRINEEVDIYRDDLIIDIWESNGKLVYKTGNWAGVLKVWKKSITIESRFGNLFMSRMLNFINNLFIDEIDPMFGEISKNPFQFILIFLFTKSLEKAIFTGLPSVYVDKKESKMKFRGKVDFSNLIKKDIPFIGKISNIHRERVVVSEIIDVLLHAQLIIQKDYETSILPRISTVLKENSRKTFTDDQIQKFAINHKTLVNPMFKDYRDALKWAIHIINSKGLNSKSNKGDKNSLGYLFNIAELFEIYVFKLLKRKFSEWDVKSPKIELYKNHFFKRKIIPDIVMKKDDKILIFDVKYKRMNCKERNKFSEGDLKRNDFFQINTYMSYYANKDYRVIVGGLLYPFEVEWEKDKCYSDNWFGNSKTRFIVDGVEIPGKDSSQNEKDWQKKLIENENKFLNRIKNYINEYDNYQTNVL